MTQRTQDTYGGKRQKELEGRKTHSGARETNDTTDTRHIRGQRTKRTQKTQGTFGGKEQNSTKRTQDTLRAADDKKSE